MNLISTIIGTPLGWVMWLCYTVVRNYGVALILFTLITRLLMFPLSVKQQKSSVKMAAFGPKMRALQTKYANNKEKLSEEMTKLYQEEGYNPMSSCLPLLIQLPILYGLIDVIYNPLKHMLRFSNEIITRAMEIAQNVLGATGGHVASAQLGVVTAYQNNPGAFAPLGQEFGQEVLDKLAHFDITFLGLNLAETPHWGFNLLVLIPILSGLSALLMSLISMRNNKLMQGENAGGGGMMKGMMLVMPLFSLFFTFSVPAGVGFYWVVSNLIAVGQTLLLNKLYDPRKIAEARAKAEEEQREQERLEKMEAKKKLKSGEATKTDREKALSEKELNRLKLAEARKRDAERYGEEYVEVTDEDLK
ncbi:MAG: YidC/Oxa1 family membrane protein insertase [Oscillospiraceae bacterium]